nr:AAA family ATPase [Actinomyces mediterranea]
MGFAPDDLALPMSLTGEEFLKFHDSLRRTNTKLRSELLAEILGLTDDIHRPIAQYSHGMKRKVQLIAALSHEPELLILDEPFRSLDPEASSILLSLLNEFTSSGRTVLIATHDMLRANRDCDTVTILNQGSIVSQGAPNELITLTPGAETLEDVFMNVTGLYDEKELRQSRLKDLFNPMHI